MNEIELSVIRRSKVSRIEPTSEIQTKPKMRNRTLTGLSTLAFMGLSLVGGIIFGNLAVVALGLGVTYVTYCLLQTKNNQNFITQLNQALEEFYDIDSFLYEEEDFDAIKEINFLQISEKSCKELSRKISQTVFLPKKIVVEMKHSDGNIDHVVATYFNKNLQSINLIESYKSDLSLWKENFSSIVKNNNLDLKTTRFK